MKNIYISICLVLFSASGFAQWTPLNSGTTFDLFSVHFPNSNTGYVSGMGQILKTTDSGLTWTAQTTNTACFLFSVFFADVNTGYAVGSTDPLTLTAKIIKTNNGGTTWTEQLSGLSNGTLKSVYFTDINNGYAVGDNGSIIKTVNGGSNWTILSSGTTVQLYSVNFTSVDTGYVVGDSGTILKTSNGGITWTALSSGVTGGLRSVYFTDANIGYIVGAPDTILKTINGGNNWTALTGTGYSGTSVHFANANTGYVACGLNILKTNNAGNNWIMQPSGTLHTLWSIFATSADTAYAVGIIGTILKTTSSCNLIVSANVTNATCDTCHDGSATGYVANGIPPYTWTWYTSPMQTTQTATGMAPGTYTLCVTDCNGCAACNNSIFIDSTNCNGYSIYAFATNATCTNCYDGTAWVNISGGTPPYSYTWYTIPMQTTDTATGLMHGTYHVCITDLNGCTVCDSVTVSTGNCSGYFYLYPDTTLPHNYYAVNMVSGVPPISYYWEWGDGTHDTIAYPSHTYSMAGFYTICLTITDSVGCTNMFCDSFYLLKNINTMVTVNVIPNIIIGISAYSIDNSFLIFPNPATNNLTIEVPQKADIEILNINGQIIKTIIHDSGETSIDIGDLSSGVYIIKAKTDKKIMTKKFIKE